LKNNHWAASECAPFSPQHCVGQGAGGVIFVIRSIRACQNSIAGRDSDKCSTALQLFKLAYI